MKKKVIITLSTIVLVAAGITALIPSNNQKNQEQLEELDEDSFFALPKEEEENLSSLLALEELNISEQKIQLPSTKNEIKDKKIISLYEEIEESELLKKVPITHGIQPKLMVKISSNSISNLEVGDTIKLPNVGQVEYEAVIRKKIIHRNGSVSVTGNLVGSQNSQYSVVFTQGEKNSYASFTTPEGAFEVKTINGIGYIYSVKDIEDRLIDPKKEDLIVAPPSKH